LTEEYENNQSKQFPWCSAEIPQKTGGKPKNAGTVWAGTEKTWKKEESH
jgi:hypothetical protein